MEIKSRQLSGVLPYNNTESENANRFVDFEAQDPLHSDYSVRERENDSKPDTSKKHLKTYQEKESNNQYENQKLESIPLDAYLEARRLSNPRFHLSLGASMGIDGNQVLTNITNISEGAFLSKDEFAELRSRNYGENFNESLNSGCNSPFGFLSPYLLKKAARTATKELEVVHTSSNDSIDKLVKISDVLKQRGEEPRNNTLKPNTTKHSEDQGLAIAELTRKRKPNSHSQSDFGLINLANLLSPTQSKSSQAKKSRFSKRPTSITCHEDKENQPLGLKDENHNFSCRQFPLSKSKDSKKSDHFNYTTEKRSDTLPKSAHGTRSVRNVTPEEQRKGSAFFTFDQKNDKVTHLEERALGKNASMDNLQYFNDKLLKFLNENLESQNKVRREHENKLASLKELVVTLQAANKELEKENTGLKIEVNHIRNELKENLNALAEMKKERDDLLAQKEKLLVHFKDYSKEFEMQLSQVRKENSKLLDAFHSFATHKSCKSNESTEMKKASSETHRYKRTASREHIKHHELADELSVGRNSAPRERELAELLHYKKNTQKFVDSITEMVMECSPKEYWKAKPSLKQIWKWLKNIITDYIDLKRKVLDGPEDSDLLKACMDFLMVKSKDDLVPFLHEVLVDNTKMAQIISKIKISYGLSAFNTLDELDAFLDKQKGGK